MTDPRGWLTLDEAVAGIRMLLMEHPDAVSAAAHCGYCGLTLEVPVAEVDEIVERLRAHIGACPGRR